MWPIPRLRATSPPTSTPMAARFQPLTRSWRNGTPRAATKITSESRTKAAGVAVVRARPSKNKTKAMPPPTTPT